MIPLPKVVVYSIFFKLGSAPDSNRRANDSNLLVLLHSSSKLISPFVSKVFGSNFIKSVCSDSKPCSSNARSFLIQISSSQVGDGRLFPLYNLNLSFIYSSVSKFSLSLQLCSFSIQIWSKGLPLGAWPIQFLVYKSF